MTSNTIGVQSRYAASLDGRSFRFLRALLQERMEQANFDPVIQTARKRLSASTKEMTMMSKPLSTSGPEPLYEQLPTYCADNVEQMLNAMHVDGFVLIPGVLQPPVIEIAREKIDRLKPIGWDYSGLTDHYKNVFNRDPFWLSFLDRKGVIDLAESALGSNCHIIGETAWRSHPGHQGMDLHLDYLPMTWPTPGVPSELQVPMFLCTAHFYLSRQTQDLCPTYLIPGSHKAGREPAQSETSWNGRLPQLVLCDAGDVLFFRSDLWHSGSVNRTSDEVRYLLQVHYGRREMAQHFAPFLQWHFNPDVLAACNSRQLRLLGDHAEGAYD